jgi:hypothetical protein
LLSSFSSFWKILLVLRELSKHAAAHYQFGVLVKKVQIFLNSCPVCINKFLDSEFVLFHHFPVTSKSIDVCKVSRGLLIQFFVQFMILSFQVIDLLLVLFVNLAEGSQVLFFHL